MQKESIIIHLSGLLFSAGAPGKVDRVNED
jgi:hypothetical protein